MQKNSFSRWWSITQPAPMTPQLYTKVVFTQQIKRRLRLKTFFILTVIVISKLFGFTSMFVHKRQLLLFSIGQRASLVPKLCWRKSCWYNKWLVIFFIFIVMKDCLILLMMMRISWSKWGSGPILAVLQCQANPWRGRSKLLNLIPLQKSV